jgi:hypothetical protein
MTTTYGIEGTFLGIWPLAYPDWAFYDIAIIKAADGLYISTDSGCSCPTPFESHSADDFTGPLTLDQVIEEFTSLVRVDGNNGEYLSQTDLDRSIAEIKEAAA